MFGLFKSDPTKKLTKELDRKRAAAVQVQRSGDLRTYATMCAEIEALEDQLIALPALRVHFCVLSLECGNVVANC